MTVTLDQIKAALAENAHLTAAAAGAGEKIHAGARARLEIVDSELDELRPRALVDDAAGEKYQALIQERGQLNIVLGKS